MLEQVLEINTSNSQTCLMSGEQIVENWNSQQQITNIAPLMISLSSSHVHAVWLWHRLFEIEALI